MNSKYIKHTEHKIAILIAVIICSLLALGVAKHSDAAVFEEPQPEYTEEQKDFLLVCSAQAKYMVERFIVFFELKYNLQLLGVEVDDLPLAIHQFASELKNACIWMAQTDGDYTAYRDMRERGGSHPPPYLDEIEDAIKYLRHEQGKYDA